MLLQSILAGLAGLVLAGWLAVAGIAPVKGGPLPEAPLGVLCADEGPDIDPDGHCKPGG